MINDALHYLPIASFKPYQEVRIVSFNSIVLPSEFGSNDVE